MAFLQDLATEIWLVLLCMDVGIFVVAGIMGASFPIHTPFNSNVISTNPSGTLFVNGTTQVTQPNIYNTTNPSGTTVSSLTTNVNNASNNNPLSGLGGILNPYYLLSALWTFIQFITGGFAFQILGLFGFPVIFIYGIQLIYGGVLVRSIIYWLLGR